METPASSDQPVNKTALPVKKIKHQEDLAAYMRSKSYASLLRFIQMLSDSVRGIARCAVPAPDPASPCGQLCTILRTIGSWVPEIPLEEVTSQRFGNKAFRTWWERLKAEGLPLLEAMWETEDPNRRYCSELLGYLLDAFGNPTRLDYGTGHELHFLIWIQCWNKLGYFGCALEEDSALASVVVLHVFWDYFELMRTLQAQYNLEPAGSHGVWGLDDYHHLPFIFGASQLIEHKEYTPAVVQDRRTVEDLKDDYLYLRSVHWILVHKKGPFHEHSSILYNISGLPTWAKTCSGMIKMHEGEVMKKFPIMQHMLFGDLHTFL